MIIEALVNLFLHAFKALFNNVHIGSIPQQTWNDILSTINSMITSAESLLDLVLPYNVAKTLLLIVIVIEGVIFTYTVIMWVLRKIPAASIN